MSDPIPAENLWGIFVRDANRNSETYYTKGKLNLIVDYKWKIISKDTLKKFWNFMMPRMTKLIENKWKILIIRIFSNNVLYNLNAFF